MVSGYFTQPVDHFDNQNPASFQQLYFKNSQWSKPGGPIFLMIGGEGPESSGWILNENITYLRWAKKFGATVYLLEHRYYGSSIVGGTPTSPNPDLTFLSSLQMLYDVANFIRTVNLEYIKPPKWITFGGSYSGSLSLWMREIFPELVHGAVGSSAPIEAKFDFYEYLEVVEASIRSYDQQCASNIAKGFKEMHQLSMTKEGRKSLSDTFRLEPPWNESTNVTETDVQFFFSNIYSQFQGAVQYSGDNRGSYASGYGIPDMCTIINNKSNDALKNIASFNEFMTTFYQDGKPFEYTANSYEEFIDYLKKAQLHGPG
ncbi:serine carboxypeptidase S28 [Dictyocaulus viviparus]|uniref:Serine carboxypeptidase S28 n=1 Tax=Dictyocaulus viviparus TaxID=29172 RepID=A0A0D8XQI2_DICVI|nr:serine carboxypeptidase S28 [Dictyocaulus viviparus]